MTAVAATDKKNAKQVGLIGLAVTRGGCWVQQKRTWSGSRYFFDAIAWVPLHAVFVLSKVNYTSAHVTSPDASGIIITRAMMMMMMII